MGTKKELEEEIAKLNTELEDNAEEYAEMRVKLEDKKVRLEERFGQIREHTKNFPDVIEDKATLKGALEYAMRVKEWREKLVGLLGQKEEKPQPKKEETSK